jgi:hypothetical protein
MVHNKHDDFEFSASYQKTYCTEVLVVFDRLTATDGKEKPGA